MLFVYALYMKKKKKLYRRKPELSFLYKLIRGAIGKEYVIKHYSYGAIRTKYPDMSRIIASAKQRKCRDIFKEAVAYAKQVIADPAGKKAWQKRIRRSNGVYNDAIKFYMLKDKKAKERDELLTLRLIRLAFKNETTAEENNIPEPKINQDEQLPRDNCFKETG
jgi:hypothetical protein